MKFNWRIWRMGKRMGLKYNETTGEFDEVPGKPQVQYDGRKGGLSSVSLPRTVRHPPRKFRRIAVPDSRRLNRVAVKWIVAPLKLIFYPFVKWWEVEKDAIAEEDWFMAVVWVIPGLVLIGLCQVFGTFVLFFFAKALNSARDVCHGVFG